MTNDSGSKAPSLARAQHAAGAAVTAREAKEASARMAETSKPMATKRVPAGPKTQGGR
jgi:hypothetical protein